MITDDGKELFTREEMDEHAADEVRFAMASEELKLTTEQIDAHIASLETERNFWNTLEQTLNKLQGQVDFRAPRIAEQKSRSAMADYLEELADKLRDTKEDD